MAGKSKKPGRGGKRPGSGRPRTHKELRTVQLSGFVSPTVANWIKQRYNSDGIAVETLVREKIEVSVTATTTTAELERVIAVDNGYDDPRSDDFMQRDDDHPF